MRLTRQLVTAASLAILLAAFASHAQALPLVQVVLSFPGADGRPERQPRPSGPYPVPGYWQSLSPPASHPPVKKDVAHKDLRRGLMTMPYAGLHAPVGTASATYDTGPRLGIILGGHLSRLVSLNGEFAADLVNHPVAGSTDRGEALLDLTFSPLFHFGGDRLEFVAGPKLGVSADVNGVRRLGVESSSGATYIGYAYGINSGLLVHRSGWAFGVLVAYTGRNIVQDCRGLPGGIDICAGDLSGRTDAKVLSLTAALRW